MQHAFKQNRKRGNERLDTPTRVAIICQNQDSHRLKSTFTSELGPPTNNGQRDELILRRKRLQSTPDRRAFHENHSLPTRTGLVAARASAIPDDGPPTPRLSSRLRLDWIRWLCANRRTPLEVRGLRNSRRLAQRSLETKKKSHSKGKKKSRTWAERPLRPPTGELS